MKNKQLKRILQIAILLSIALFLLSLTQKCFCTITCTNSIWAFLGGWMGVFFGGSGYMWVANPFLITSWIYVTKNRKASVVLSVLAALTALCFLTYNQVVITTDGTPQNISNYRLGYWLWLGSCLVMMSGNVIEIVTRYSMADQIMSNRS